MKEINNSLPKEELLLEEAKNRYPVGTKFFPAHLNQKDEYCIVTEDSIFEFFNNNIILKIDNCKYNNNIIYGGSIKNVNFGTIYNRVIYHNNQWAKIVSIPEEKKEFNRNFYVEVKSQEEYEKVCKWLKDKGEENIYKESYLEGFRENLFFDGNSWSLVSYFPFLPLKTPSELGIEEDKWIPKVGDWVVVLESDTYYVNCEKGKAQQINKIRGGDKLPYELKFSHGGTNTYSKIRKALPHEIPSLINSSNSNIYNTINTNNPLFEDLLYPSKGLLKGNIPISMDNNYLKSDELYNPKKSNILDTYIKPIKSISINLI